MNTKRPATTPPTRMNKKPKMSSSSNLATSKSSGMAAVQKMMAKMGHVDGSGLGASAGGMVEPIAVKLRPQGAGVGIVKEKTAQAKAQEKRAAEQRGEEYVDSSEDERRERRRRKEAIRKKIGEPAAGAVQEKGQRRARQKVRTITEIEDEDGLQVPDVFKNFIDLSGAAPKQITSTADLGKGKWQVAQGEPSVREKIIKNAQLELEAFASTWRELQDRKKFLDMQEAELAENVGDTRNLISGLDELATIANRLSSLQIDSNSLETRMQTTLTELEKFKTTATDAAGTFNQELAAAAIGPLVTAALDEWVPFEQPASVLPFLPGIKSMLANEDIKETQKTNDYSSPSSTHAQSQQLDLYESIIFSRWLPKIRTAITNEWNVYDPTPVLKILTEWKEFLPDFLKSIVVDQLVAQKLSEKLKLWNPTSSRKQSSKTPQAHTWLFPWLEHLGSYHMDPHSANGLLAEVRRKFRSMFQSWNPNKGLIVNLNEWLAVSPLKRDLHKDLNVKLLPRLSQYLRDDFEIDPSDQDRSPIDMVLQWSKYFGVDKFARVFLEAFFPKLLHILHIWLKSDPNYEEVGQWYEWWHKIFPAELNAEPAVAAQWEKGLEMMSSAVEFGPEHLEEPTVEPELSALKEGPVKKEEAPKPTEESVTMKDMLEELCTEEDLLLLPLRKAHPETGLPLLRITASASGGGGVVVYVTGDVVMANNRKDRNLWEPLDIFAPGILSHLAESK